LSKLSLYPPTLDGFSVEQKRQEILEYFHNTYDLFEKMFDVLSEESVFYKKSEKTRHPMIFYYGHTAVFFINKLINMKIIDKRVNPDFESIFAVGVDEMEWDDLDESRYKWPKVSEVKEYREQVREVVDALIKNMPIKLPITWDSDAWIVLMGIEHERIHIETSSVLHRQMPLEYVKCIPEFKTCEVTHPVVNNSLVKIPATSVRLGKNRDDRYYGWDNEYGEFTQDVKSFGASKYLVSNAEFLEFVNEGGYEKEEFWCEEGREFLKRTDAQHPPFWIKESNGYSFRTLTKKIDLPLSWPVEVNNLEAMAFCRYKSQKEGKNYTLPSEAEYEAMCKYVGVEDMQSELYANHNFDMIGSVSVDVNEYMSEDEQTLYDVLGNVWQHSRTPIRPFEGFEVHKAYDDFTTPTFDEKHALILGSSWASSGNLIMKHSRYAFRRHFYQHAGFRYVEVTSEQSSEDNIYESDKLVSQYCDFQYGDEYFGVKHFSLSCVDSVLKYLDKKEKALDIGCATGRASFELAKHFESVEGIDFSVRFIGVGTKLKTEGYIAWRSKIEGDIYKDKKVTLEDLGYKGLEDKVVFWQGDACNLKPNFSGYDLVLAKNLLDRLYDPKMFLESIKSRINKGGILMLTSPYTWQESSTKKDLWLGGYLDAQGNEIRTIDGLKEILEDEFELLELKDIEFVIKETNRKFQHSVAEASIWKKR
jgi:5-histidylcysteine sulfoxide synthase/putative 4-mercaptohistidine N1-methyltranferase